MDKKRVQTLKEIDSNDLKEYREKKWNKGIREEYIQREKVKIKWIWEKYRKEWGWLKGLEESKERRD